MIRKILIYFCLITFGIFSSGSVAEKPQGLKIHLICQRNGVGLSQDIDILMQTLKDIGHSPEFVDVRTSIPIANADINLFIDYVNEAFFPFAAKNFLIPNPDWCFLTPEQIARFDMILCKTREGERIFKPLNSNTTFISFTSKDRYDPNIQKLYKVPLHVAGASISKGTDAVVSVWRYNSNFPQLLLLKHKGKIDYPKAENIFLINSYLPDASLKYWQNSRGLHICPSEIEGFGHYLMEGLSTGAVVVTTDAPPMNEFVSDRRCLVSYKHKEPWRLGVNYYVDSQALEQVVANLLTLPEVQLKEIGQKNREFFLENDKFFKKRLSEIFSCE